MNKLAIKCIPLYFIVLFFYGVLIKLTINYPILFSLKTIIPELLLTIIILSGLINIFKRKMKINNKLVFIFTVYFILIVILNLLNKPSVDEILMLFRDLGLPIMAFFSIYQLNISKESVSKIINELTIISTVFIVLGFILSMMQTTLGWKWSSSFYTGYEFYGLDQYSKVKIWHAGNMLRVPSLTGSSVSFAFYNIISYLFVLTSNFTLLIKIGLMLLAIMNIYLSTSKTALIIVIIITLLNFIMINKKETKTIVLITVFSIAIGIFILVIVKNPNLMFSFKERIYLWEIVAENLTVLNILIPLNLFNTTAASSSGFMSILDNSYIYFIVSIGIIGTIILSLKIIMLLKYSKKNKYGLFINYLILTFIIASTMINITQGRGLFNLFCILIPIFEEINLNKYNSIVKGGRNCG